MQLPFFFEEDFPAQENPVLSEETSRHIVQVLRMHENENLLITNGKGQLFTVRLIKANKKNAEVAIIKKSARPKLFPEISIGISLIKNVSRFEWFLEKAAEIGIADIIPLICDRTEKQRFRYDRMKNIIVSAMLQSQQAWLPVLHEPVKFPEFIKNSSYQNKYIAHCMDEVRQPLSNQSISKQNKLILIGPEGDFTKDEITAALENNYTPVSLGETRLRTETAGIVAAVLLLNR